MGPQNDEGRLIVWRKRLNKSLYTALPIRRGNKNINREAKEKKIVNILNFDFEDNPLYESVLESPYLIFFFLIVYNHLGFKCFINNDF